MASDLTSAPGDRARMLPVHPDLAGLFPQGALRRGTTVTVRGSTSLLFALLAPPTSTGSWAALVGMPDLGLRAAAELGVAVGRLALVRHPGARVAAVVAALLDGMDVVAVDPARLPESHARRLSVRARNRGAVLLATGPWPGADLELAPAAATWTGLGEGSGYLAVREARVAARGRGAAARPVRAEVRLPGAPPPVFTSSSPERGGAVSWPPARESEEQPPPPPLVAVAPVGRGDASAHCSAEDPFVDDWRRPGHADVS